MHKIEGMLARLFLMFGSVLFACVTIELASRYYLWHIASEDRFKEFASISQIKDRYGDDFFIRSNTDGSADAMFLSPHHYLGYFPTPNLQIGENRHNSLGFRGEEISVRKGADKYRIALVGGSTTYSTGVEDYRHSYPYQLEEYLHENGYESIEVINAGVGAYTTYNSLINIQFRVLPLQPDLIIIYQGINDVEARLVYPHSEYLGDNSGFLAPFVSDTIMPEIWQYSTALRILGIRAGYMKPHSDVDWHRRPMAASSMRSEFRSQWVRGIYPSGIFAEVSVMEILETNTPVHFERNLRNMIAVADTFEAKTLLVTFVTSTEFNSPTVASDEYIFALAQHNEVTRNVADSTVAELFDMAKIFPDDPLLYTDGAHMNKEGNRLRAQLIGNFIINRFLP